MSAAAITGKTLEYYLDYKKQNGTHHEDRKKVGKIAELSSGYGGWIGAWKAFGATQDDDELKDLILKWRDASPEIVEFWGGQFRQVGAKPWDAVPELFGLEGAAIAAIMQPGKCFTVGPYISYGVHNDILFCRLPSGRFLQYHQPRLVPTEDRLKRGPAVKITFMGYNSNPAKGPAGWQRMETYGGRLAENVTQAVAADIQSEALVRVEAAGYPIVMHTHDEIIAECPDGFGSWQEMADIMSQRPTWCPDWPIKADGWEHVRYQKD
jgi:DNA polymerase